MSGVKELKKELERLEEELNTLEASRPAHSVSIDMEMKIENLRERIEQIRSTLR